jgi:hypothetical protein
MRGFNIMNFNFNIGGVRVTYQTSGGTVRQATIFTRLHFNHIESNHTLIEANQTNIKNSFN